MSRKAWFQDLILATFNRPDARLLLPLTGCLMVLASGCAAGIGSSRAMERIEGRIHLDFTFPRNQFGVLIDLGTDQWWWLDDELRGRQPNTPAPWTYTLRGTRLRLSLSRSFGDPRTGGDIQFEIIGRFHHREGDEVFGPFKGTVYWSSLQRGFNSATGSPYVINRIPPELGRGSFAGYCLRDKERVASLRIYRE